MALTPSSNFLTSKAGPLPVWGWGAVGLGAAYAWSRHQVKKSQSTAQTPPATAAGEPVSGQPTYLIENNIPGFGYPSAPVTTPGVPTPPVVTPPNTTPTPPIPVDRPPHPVIPGTPGTAPPPHPTPNPVPVGGKSPITYRVMPGDTLSKIATQYRVPGGWQALFAYNTNPKFNAAASTFARQGPNLLYAGQTIHIPQ